MVVVVAPRAAGLTNCNQTNWMGKEDGRREGGGSKYFVVSDRIKVDDKRREKEGDWRAQIRLWRSF